MDHRVYSQFKKLFLYGGIAGVLSVISYLCIITVSLNPALTFVGVMLFSILGIISWYALHILLKGDMDDHLSVIGFYMGALAFLVLAVFLAAQIAIQAGFEDSFIKELSVDPNTSRLVQRAVRLIDMGLDVVWDMFIGTSFLCYAIVMRRHPYFGWIWTLPFGLLAILLIVLNAATFPWPPSEMGLFDVGPFCGLFMIAIHVRMIGIAIRMNKRSAPEADH
ncbi:hypothetical protein L6Q79_12375 [bacterium]|nr:hypothetical protein [bacterium]NUN45301.1 hypothetical protein [bacterium]